MTKRSLTPGISETVAQRFMTQEQTVEHVYAEEGTYNVTMAVSDGLESTSQTTTAEISTAPTTAIYVRDEVPGLGHSRPRRCELDAVGLGVTCDR